MPRQSTDNTSQAPMRECNTPQGEVRGEMSLRIATSMLLALEAAIAVCGARRLGFLSTRHFGPSEWRQATKQVAEARTVQYVGMLCYRLLQSIRSEVAYTHATQHARAGLAGALKGRMIGTRLVCGQLPSF